MLDQLPNWIQQAAVQSQLPRWMQDPPPKKKSALDLAGTLDWLNQKLQALGPTAVAQAKEMGQEAIRDPRTFTMGMVGTGELGGAGGVAHDLAGLIGKDANHSVLDVVRSLVRNKPMARISAVDAPAAQRMAKAYEALPKSDPAAKGAYDALNKEVARQFKAIKKAGYNIEFVDKDPYANSAEMMKDVRENKTLKVFKTPEDGEFHPYMTPEQNNVFRAVHDWIAHAGPGNQFGPIGEENAYRMHAATLSPEAQQALATETRGQNSWVNFGPNAHLPVKERPFAEQKAALWPKDLLGDYSEMPTEKAAAPSILIPGGDVKTPLKLAERFKDSPADVSARVQQALDVLNQPVTPWEPTPRGLLDRSLIVPDDLSKAGPPVLPHERVAPKTDRKAMGHLVSLAAPENIDLIQRQIKRGEKLGGPTFYPSFRAIDDAIGNAGGDPELFRHATSAGSARNSIHNEQSVGSAIMYALKRGVIDLDAIAQAQAKGPKAVLALSKKVQRVVEKDFPDSKGLPLMPTHLQIFRQLREGIPPTGSYKIPTYSAQKAGHLFGWVGDTHEATGGTLGSPYHRYFSEHGGFEPEEYGPAEGLFSDVAMQLGLTPRAGQASRWMGGGELTGLKSAMGDAAQHLEDNVFWNAKERGLDPKKLLKSVARGDNILFPYFKKGRLPLY